MTKGMRGRFKLVGCLAWHVTSSKWSLFWQSVDDGTLLVLRPLRRRIHLQVPLCSYGGFVLWRFGQAIATGSLWSIGFPMMNVYAFLSDAIPAMEHVSSFALHVKSE